MKSLELVLATALFASVGCHDASMDLEKFADRACACKEAKDAACAEKVVNEFAAWLKNHKDAHGDRDRTNNAATRVGRCTIEAGLPLEKLQAAMTGIE